MTRSRVRGSSMLLLVVAATTACSTEGRPAAPRDTTTHTRQSTTRAAAEPAGASRHAAPEPPTACRAPSLTVRLPIDGRDSKALSQCPDMRSGAEAVAERCGEGEPQPELDWARFDEAVLAFDGATETKIRSIAARGRELGRNPRAFGQVGDSMTASGAFLRPFSANRRGTEVELAAEARRALATPVGGRSGGTIIDYYRGAQAQRVRGLWTDAFGAPKAAKVGARSTWALVDDRHEQSPVAIMVRNLSPAVAVVVFGGNDAAYRVAPPEEIAKGFEQDFEQVLDALERRGVVPILSTIARHGLAPGLPRCGRKPDELSNWRLAVQTNAVNAAVARIACRRQLPLVDLRHALDSIPNYGLGPDGVHPSAYQGGAGLLTARGLQCGYNVRNYVTLLMLRRVKELLEPETDR